MIVITVRNWTGCSWFPPNPRSLWQFNNVTPHQTQVLLLPKPNQTDWSLFEDYSINSMLAQWCVRLTTPSAFRLVPYKPEAILSPLGAKSLRNMTADCRSVRLAARKHSYVLSHLQYRLNKEYIHLLSCVFGSCWSEENRNDPVFFGSVAPTIIPVGNTRGEKSATLIKTKVIFLFPQTILNSCPLDV